ncbi:hypothetical protein Dimus_023572 [Dionaea muscipula]
MAERDWSDLPSELLVSISEKLMIYADYIRLRSVCLNWRSGLPTTPHHLPCQLPWLMLPPLITTSTSSSTSDHRRSCRGFYNLVNNKVHYLNLPEASRPRRVCCSSLGWLVVVNETPEIYCLNPLTRSKVYLPPLSTFPNVIDFSFYNVGREYIVRNSMGYVYSRNLKQMRDFYLKKVVFSASPGNGGDYIVMAIVNYTGEMVYCEGGDDSWRLIEGATRFSCEDVIYDKGLFFGVDKFGKIATVDVRTANGRPLVKLKIIKTPVVFGGDMMYLVNLEDDLLLVTRVLGVQCLSADYLVHKTTQFYVHKLDTSEPRWEVVRELGNYALFFGLNSSLLRSASDFGGCKGNCIYFTDDHSEYASDDGWRYHDMGIFNLEGGSIEPLPCYCEGSDCAPMWITPNPC